METDWSYSPAAANANVSIMYNRAHISQLELGSSQQMEAGALSVTLLVLFI